MGFTINTVLVPTLGLTLQNGYITIKGQFRVSKRSDSPIFGTNETYPIELFPSVASARYFLFANSNYNALTPCLEGSVFVFYNPDGLDADNVHKLLYQELKSRFAGDGIELTDDL